MVEGNHALLPHIRMISKDRKVIVVGGGEEALRKVRLLLKTKARILVVAPLLHDELAAEPRVEWLATAVFAQSA